MRHKLLLMMLFALMALTLISPVSAITYGIPDGGAHPYVGLMYFEDVNGDGYVCSGSAVSSTVFVTAGHCAEPAAFTLVNFSESPVFSLADPNWVSGTAIPHPNFGAFALPNTYDIGVVILDDPVTLPRYATIASLGFLNTLEAQRGTKDTSFTPVGYGLQGVKPREIWDLSRYKGEQQLINLRSAFAGGYNIKLTNNPGNGTGGAGTCSGDSGGPILYSNTDIIVAINSFGIAPHCKGNDYAFRADTSVAQDFLDDFVSLGD